MATVIEGAHWHSMVLISGVRVGGGCRIPATSADCHTSRAPTPP